MLIKSDSEAAKIQDLSFKMNYLQKQSNYLKIDKTIDPKIRQEKMQNLEKQISILATEIKSLEAIVADSKPSVKDEKMTQPIYLNDASKKIIVESEFTFEVCI